MGEVLSPGQSTTGANAGAQPILLVENSAVCRWSARTARRFLNRVRWFDFGRGHLSPCAAAATGNGSGRFAGRGVASLGSG